MKIYAKVSSLLEDLQSSVSGEKKAKLSNSGRIAA